MKTLDLQFCEPDPGTTLLRACEEAALTLSAPHHLASYPGSLHWHICLSGSKGVLEVTWWPANRRFWLKVAANREGPWIGEAIEIILGRFAKGSPPGHRPLST
jgi:hypothetical protein